MANKRKLKKAINNVCADLATECLIAGQYVKGVDADKMDTLIDKLANIQSGALSSIYFSFDKVSSDFDDLRAYHKARTAYFHKAYASLREKFSNHVQEIVNEMNAALPAEVKEANKKSLME